jgi:leader peptidase (prepilin peptidase)/N-methyltransferase
MSAPFLYLQGELMLLLLQTSPLFFTVLAGILGLTVGSFLNVVIHRLPRMMEREWPRSVPN